MRTPQTFFQELLLPFVIVLLFVAIGQADFLIESPALDLDPSSYGPSTLFYNNEHLKQTKPLCMNPQDQ